MADIELNSDQMGELANTVADTLFEKMTKQQEEAAAAAAQKEKDDEDAAAAAAAEGSDGDSDVQKLDMKALADQITKNLQGTTQADAAKVYGVMFNEKLTAAEGAIPGFTEFLEGKDDFGRVRKEQLEGIESYQDRIEALNTLSSSFKEATAGGGGGKQPTVSKKVQKQVQDNQNRHKETNDKFDKGEINLVQFAEESMANITEEIGSIFGNA